MAQFASRARQSSATFTPAAASHTNGDVNGGAQTFASLGDPNSLVKIEGVRMTIASGTVETTAWALHLFTSAPTVIADDAVFDVALADLALYQGSIVIPQVLDLGASLFIDAWGSTSSKIVRLGSTGGLIGYLVNGTTLTPGAVAHIVTLTVNGLDNG